MLSRLFWSVFFGTLFLLLAQPFTMASAQDNRIRLEVGGGIGVIPLYEGSDDYQFTAAPIISLVSVKLGDLRLGGNQDLGWRFGPSFRYVGERKQSDDHILTGIPDVDDSIEIGLHVAYEWENARVYVQGRYGVTGHNSFNGEAGADLLYRPTDEIEIAFGPRVGFADSDYMDAYFSVPDSAVHLSKYNASGGIRSAGLETNIRYDFSDNWAVAAGVQWNRLIGDAADSPIVKAGSENQFSARIGLVYKFDFGF